MLVDDSKKDVAVWRHYLSRDLKGKRELSRREGWKKGISAGGNRTCVRETKWLSIARA